MLEFRETWKLVDGEIVAAGDKEIIDHWLAHKLEKMRADNSGWRTLYRHHKTGQYWELSYPRGEIHGGGPRLLRCLNITDRSQWTVD